MPPFKNRVHKLTRTWVACPALHYVEQFTMSMRNC
nr:MAG TPA: hypothetical protein [Herelleviridae sp.]